MKFSPSFTPSPVALAVLLLPALHLPSQAGQTDIESPPGGERFGGAVTVLPNGNIVVVDQLWDNGWISNAGAVYLYSPAGVLVSRLTGTQPGDMVGSGGIVVLTNGNYVVCSYHWDNGKLSNAGAVTWCDAETGLNGEVSVENSLAGSSHDDSLGDTRPATGGGVTPLTNGNYVVCNPSWRNGDLPEAGAVTWGDGRTGTKGVVSAANSLIGTAKGDQLGSTQAGGGVTALSNGNYVVCSPFWRNGTRSKAGAVTWGGGEAGVSGVVSAANSLVGTAPEDQLGSTQLGGGVTALRNGDYVVCSPLWNNGGVQDAGAVVWCAGGAGRAGALSAENALVGTRAGNSVGRSSSMPSVVELANGNYVVRSPVWTGADKGGAGAVTWCPGGAGLAGPVSPANSLISNSTFSSPRVTPLTDGNYLVSSTGWNDDTGAVTWCDGSTGTAGFISASNSLTGVTKGDRVGAEVAALPGGHYVVCSPGWSMAWRSRVGAVTRVPGGAPFSGVISAANSLVGSTSGDAVGGGGVTVLANGHYVVCSPSWNNGAVSRAGAVTWCDGLTGRTGPVSSENSLTGSTPSDAVGGGGVTVLANGHYVVGSPSWDNGAAPNTGAVTWCHGFTGLTGAVSSENSLTGASAGDSAGFAFMDSIPRGVVALPNGNYVVNSPRWHRGQLAGAGAVTWCPGDTGLCGPVTEANSLTGSSGGDSIGGGVTAAEKDTGGVTVLSNGDYVVGAPFWDNELVLDAGAVIRVSGAKGLTGVITPENALTGDRPSDSVGSGGVQTLANGNYVVFSPSWYNPAIPAEKAGAVTLGKGAGGTTGSITLENSVPGTIPGGGAKIAYAADAAGTMLAVSRHRDNLVNLLSHGIPNRPRITLEQPETVKLAHGGGVDFGAAAPGSSKTIRFVLTNTGYAPLTPEIAVLNNPAFSLVGAPAGFLSPGERAFIMVRFTPAAAGPQTAVLRITGADAERSPFEITLTGTGLSSAPAVFNDLTGPPGGGRFGHGVTVLPNGNFVVTDPFFDLPGPVKDAGAVYFYSASGTLVSTLTGSSANDRAGYGGVTVLKNGNWVVKSPHWSKGAAMNAGAVTWGSGTAGISGRISESNSLTGSTADDFIGAAFSHYSAGSIARDVPWGVTALDNGNYVVCSMSWDNGAVTDSGAVTWCDGTAGRAGVVNADNSLTGGASEERAGEGGVTALANGNYVVGTPRWSQTCGAVTWGDGTAGVGGVISPENSLTGSAEGDHAGKLTTFPSPDQGVFPLPNGNYVVCSPYWSKGRGAASWCDGLTGRRGAISMENSLTGVTEGDSTGWGMIPLTNGNYVVISGWKKGALQNAGAVTWCDGAVGRAGPVTEANSLIGTGEGALLGYSGVHALSDGNYIVGDIRGLLIHCDGAAGRTGIMTAENSLSGVASITSNNALAALPGGAFVVCNPYWNDSRGAVTWCPPGGRPGETMGPANSLTGTVRGDRAGSGGVTALPGGNYVVCSPDWSNGTVRTGAVTWCGAGGITGEISAANSLTGGPRIEDPVFGMQGEVSVLSNGNYLVISPLWERDWVNAGAITWGGGAMGVRGVISPLNSLTGSSGYDLFGGRVLALDGGHYAVHAPSWKNGVSPVSAGAVVLGTGTGMAAGLITAFNSVQGVSPGGGSEMNVTFRASDRTFFVGRPADNVVTLFRYHAGGPAPAPALTVSQSGGAELANGGALNFGEVKPGESASLTLTAKNIGESAFSLGTPGLDNPRFTVTAAPPAGAVLTPGESREFTVTFTPDLPGQKSAALRITGGDPAAELFALTLTGTGKAAGGTGGPFGENGGVPRAERLADGRVRVTFKALPGVGYLLQLSTDLETWSEGAPVTADAAGNILWTDEAPPVEKVFYRLKVP